MVNYSKYFDVSQKSVDIINNAEENALKYFKAAEDIASEKIYFNSIPLNEFNSEIKEMK